MIHFISDLHLAPQAPGVTRIFLDYLDRLGALPHPAERLFILGDLFEVWPGDDCLDDPADAPEDAYNRRIVGALRTLSDRGVEVAVMRGNRDFLLGDDFARRSGARLIADPTVLSLPAWQFVLAHGDHLCTDDTDYQAFRAQVRARVWRDEFLRKPLRERQAIASALRRQSEQAKREKLQSAQYTMDVNAAATDDFLRDHGYATCIHGHTHRPAKHDHIVDGIHVERWVLADWREDYGEALTWDGSELKRVALR